MLHVGSSRPFGWINVDHMVSNRSHYLSVLAGPVLVLSGNYDLCAHHWKDLPDATRNQYVNVYASKASLETQEQLSKPPANPATCKPLYAQSWRSWVRGSFSMCCKKKLTSLKETCLLTR